MNEPLISEKTVYIAYKKFKSSIYFDKTELPVVQRIVEYEAEHPDIEKKFKELAEIITNGGKPWESYVDNIIKDIKVTVCPKKLSESNGEIIFNSNKNINVESVQYFIDLPIEGHILGVLWIFFVGSLLDKRVDDGSKFMNQYSFGNRVSKKLMDSKAHKVTESPFLFESYFSQYDSWRTEALESAKRLLGENKDVIILNLDLKRFFYSIHIPEDYYGTILDVCKGKYSDAHKGAVERLHKFVYSVLAKYSKKARGLDLEVDIGKVNEKKKNLSLWENGKQNEGVFLPIGFLPSNILSNWYLTPFDNAVNDYMNPIYYGRYVDDIIIVNKVEEGTDIANKAKGELKVEDVLEYYFCRHKENKILIKCDADNPTAAQNEETFRYKINPEILFSSKRNENDKDASEVTEQKEENKKDINVIVQNDKVKVFYFNEDENSALIDCFENEIGLGSSEFRFLPEVDDVLLDKNYGKVLTIYTRSNSPKLRNIENFDLDKFSLSKFLGKYRKVSRIIDGYEYKDVEEELIKLLSKRTLIDNYTLWDRLLEIMLVNGNYEHYDKLVHKIVQAIAEVKAVSGGYILDVLKSALAKNLYVAICKTAALCWGNKWKAEIKKIEKYLFETNKYKELFKNLDKDIENVRLKYWKAYMVNKYMLPVPIVYIDVKELEDKTEDINLSDFKQCIPYFKIPTQISSILKSEQGNTTINLSGGNRSRNTSEEFVPESNPKIINYFLPYVISPQEISYATLLASIYAKVDIKDPKASFEEEKQIWKILNNFEVAKKENGQARDTEEISKSSLVKEETETADTEQEIGIEVEDERFKSFDKAIKIKKLFSDKNNTTGKASRDFDYYAVSVGENTKEEIKIGIGNICLEEELIGNLLVGKLDRSYMRYKKLANILGLALKEKVDLLVLPESYIPVDWLLEVYRFCVNSQIALVTGIEHVINKDSVYNLTAVILPYETGKYRYAHIEYHQKVHFSPEETRQIEGHGYRPKEGNMYTLFKWKDLWFAVYCCFELTSIIERSKFQSLADMIVAVEWNKDVTYFNNIIESLSRDLHCYCIQSNNAKYGDNRIVVPAKSYMKDLVKSKGGTNEIILVDTIKLSSLREFQCKNYELQKDDHCYKPTPPNFDSQVSRYKMEGKLWENLEEVKEQVYVSDTKEK